MKNVQRHIQENNKFHYYNTNKARVTHLFPGSTENNANDANDANDDSGDWI